MQHRTVLLHESIDGLNLSKGNIFVDGTLGNGGHTEEVCKRFGKDVSIFAIDQDVEAIERAKKRLSSYENITYLEGNFKNISELLQSAGVGKVNSILLDIGLSSNQLEESGRGFSFQKDEPLIMSFKKDLTEEDLTAKEVVNTWDEENLRDIISGYGEEKFAWRIAKAIVRSRQIKSIETTTELVDIIISATPFFYHRRKIHPATKTFQALRIVVNNEIENLKEGIVKSFDLLEKDGRLGIISFHSLEDRVVKNYFRDFEKDEKGERVTKKPITPKEDEILENPRSRSAKLRIIKKL